MNDLKEEVIAELSKVQKSMDMVFTRIEKVPNFIQTEAFKNFVEKLNTAKEKFNKIIDKD